MSDDDVTTDDEGVTEDESQSTPRRFSSGDDLRHLTRLKEILDYWPRADIDKLHEHWERARPFSATGIEPVLVDCGAGTVTDLSQAAAKVLVALTRWFPELPVSGSSEDLEAHADQHKLMAAFVPFVLEVEGRALRAVQHGRPEIRVRSSGPPMSDGPQDRVRRAVYASIRVGLTAGRIRTQGSHYGLSDWDELVYWVLLLRHHLGAYGPYMKGSGRRAGENRTAAEILALLAGRQQQAKALLNKLDRWVSPSWLDGNPLWDLAAELVPKWIRA